MVQELNPGIPLFPLIVALFRAHRRKRSILYFNLALAIFQILVGILLTPNQPQAPAGQSVGFVRLYGIFFGCWLGLLIWATFGGSAEKIGSRWAVISIGVLFLFAVLATLYPRPWY